MSKIGVSLKIDVTKIEKDRLHKGAKGTYLDATVFLDLSEKDKYGQSGMIAQSVSKEERDSGVKGAILGNGTIFYAEGIDMPRDGAAQPAPQPAAPQNDIPSEDIPF